MTWKIKLNRRKLKKLNCKTLKEFIHYEKNTGVFVRIKSTSVKNLIGNVAGSVNSHGYVTIKILNKTYSAHRLAWLYMKGEWPKHDIDHKNGNKSDNKWKNLRKATSQQNMQNRRIHKNNKSGLKGVSIASLGAKRSKPWRAFIQVDNKNICLGYFKTAKEASEAYKKASLQLHKEFSRLS